MFSIKQKLNNAWSWVKSKTKQILVGSGIVGVAVAASVSNQPVVSSIQVEGQTISFPYTDNNTNENFIIYTDQQNYSGLYGKDNVDIYVAIQNKSGKKQTSNVQFYFPRSDITVNSVEKMGGTGSYQATVIDYATSSVWNATTSKYDIIYNKVGEHKETKTGTVWVNASTTSFNQSDNIALLKKGKLAEKQKLNQKADRKVQDSISNNGISYYKVNIKIPYTLQKEEFYIEVVGENGGYGLLDPTLQETYALHATYLDAYYDVHWFAQTFTTVNSYTITSVRQWLSNPGAHAHTLTIGIRATDGSGNPTGGDLCSGSMSAADVPAGPGEVTISLGAGYALSAGTKYAIVGRIPDASGSGDQVNLYGGNTDDYTGGARQYSSDSGVSWSGDTAYDYYFETWGTAAGAVVPRMQVIIIN